MCLTWFCFKTHCKHVHLLFVALMLVHIKYVPCVYPSVFSIKSSCLSRGVCQFKTQQCSLRQAQSVLMCLNGIIVSLLVCESLNFYCLDIALLQLGDLMSFSLRSSLCLFWALGKNNTDMRQLLAYTVIQIRFCWSNCEPRLTHCWDLDY